MAAVAVGLPSGASGLGRWLVVADPLEPARAVAVLSGRVPFRAMEAATLYRDGLAPEVWLTNEVRTAEELALDHLGVTVFRREVYNREALERLGVKREAIRLLDDRIRSTADEVRVIAAALRPPRARDLGRAGRELAARGRPLPAGGALRGRSLVAEHPGCPRCVARGVRSHERVGRLSGAAGSTPRMMPVAPDTAARYSPASATKRMRPRLAQTST